jgi:hypothetical protein
MIGISPAKAPSATVARRSPAAWHAALWPGRVAVLRYAAVLVAGVALGLIGGRWMGPRTEVMRPSSVAGTMAPAGSTGASEWQVDLQGLHGVVRWEQTPPVVVLECDLEGRDTSAAPDASGLVIDYDPTKARFAGFEQAAPEGVALRLDEGRISIQGPFRAPFTLRFARSGSGEFGATLTFLRAGEVLGTKELTFTGQQ